MRLGSRMFNATENALVNTVTTTRFEVGAIIDTLLLESFEVEDTRILEILHREHFSFPFAPVSLFPGRVGLSARNVKIVSNNCKRGVYRIPTGGNSIVA